jgi:hypothetical protein
MYRIGGTLFPKIFLSGFTALALAGTAGAQGSSAILTLVMPVGARQLGMGETSVGLADDVFATYWNPAGLAFGPLADEWELALPSAKLSGKATAMTSTKRTGLFSRGEVYIASGSDLRRWDGKAWRSDLFVPLEQGEKAGAVVRKFMGNLWPSDTASQKALEDSVLRLSGASRAEDEKDLVELRVPYSLVVKDSIRAIAVDETGKLWLGTTNGLVRWDGKAWKVWRDSGSGLTSDRITALSTNGAGVWIGTENGLLRLKQKGNDFEFRRFGETFGLNSQFITSLVTDEKTRTLWAGTYGGVSRLEVTAQASTWKPFTKVDGLLSDTALALTLDPDGQVWVAQATGVVHFDGKTWERLLFQAVNVNSIAVDKGRNVWIGSDKGVWKYYPLAAEKKESGGKADGQKQGKWVHYHSGNGLIANDAGLVSAQGDDVWFATSKGIVKALKAKARLGLFYENLLPALQLKDLYHTYAAGTFPVEEWGTFGGFVNFLSLGQTTYQESESAPVQTFASYEMVAAISYGTRLNRNWGLGLNLKFLYSALASGITMGGQKESGVAASYAFDASVLRKNLFVPGLTWGAQVQNIGPAVFYISKDEADPIPLTWKTGFSYLAFKVPGHSLTVAADISRETVSREQETSQARNFLTGTYYGIAEPWGEGKAPSNSTIADVVSQNFQQSVYNLGLEYTYSQTLSLRGGFLFDPGGSRQEADLGVGVTISDLLTVDYAYIKDVQLIGNQPAGVREGQSRLSMNFMF